MEEAPGGSLGGGWTNVGQECRGQCWSCPWWTRGGAGSLPRSPSPLWLSAATLWKPPPFILVQFLIPNKSKKSSGSCYAISLLCTKYIILGGRVMTSSWGLHTKACTASDVLLRARQLSGASVSSGFLNKSLIGSCWFVWTMLFMPIFGTQSAYTLLNTEGLIRCCYWRKQRLAYNFPSVAFFPLCFPNFRLIQ